ncbi:unnamed protein product, partial [Hapterophycus canaliculatus]
MSSTTNRSSFTATPTMSTTCRSSCGASTRVGGVGDGDNEIRHDPRGDSEEWGDRRNSREHEEEIGSRVRNGITVRWPLLPGEQRKKSRRNQAHLRRNTSRLRHTERSLVALECRGCFVLPEIIKMQASHRTRQTFTPPTGSKRRQLPRRLFRAKRTRRIYEQRQACRNEQQAAWDAKGAREREERAARWKASMSRLKAPCLRSFQENPGDCAAIARKVEGGTSREALEDPQEGRDAPYASAQWSLAVAFDVGSWGGGLRQRYYFGRLKSFLSHRRGRKAAFRARVETRMVVRLQAWAMLLSQGKRSLVYGVKARAPAEVVGAHLRFLSRKGTWERLLLDLHQILETATFERERAMNLLSEQVQNKNCDASGRGLRTHSTTPKTSVSFPGTPCIRPSSNSPPSELHRCARSDRYTSDGWAAGGLPLAQGLLEPGTPGVVASGLANHPFTSEKGMMGFRGRSRAEARRQARLRGVVDGRTLQRLHPWVVALLAGSKIQFVPSVPQKNRVGYRMHDAKKMEILAETQLTRRYWKLLDGVSGAIVCVCTAKVEAMTLAAEAGEWAVLLGFAHHLTSKGLLDPPCSLPKLPRASCNPGTGNGVHMPGVMTKHAKVLLAPMRRQQTGGVLGLQSDSSAGSSRVLGTPEAMNENLHDPPPAPGGRTGFKDQDWGGEPRPTPRWLSADKHLCENCWALRIGASAAGGSKCQRCGQTHRRGYSQAVRKRGSDGAVGPFPWQQLSQVDEPIDLFVVHAAYACILHPGYRTSGAALPADGGIGWWNGGNPEEASPLMLLNRIWWRAVCGGKKAAKHLRGHGLGKVGQLYARAHGSGAAACTGSAPSSTCSALVGSASSTESGVRIKKLQRLVKDDDLAIKISSLLLRLMSAFEELRVQGRWPSVSKTAVDRALRCIHPP